jgi:puromycin-sensitive aminopeptidase
LFRDGLANFGSEELLSQALSFSISENVRCQDSAHYIGAIACNPRGRELSWDFFTRNFNLLKSRSSPSFPVDVKTNSSELFRFVSLYFVLMHFILTIFRYKSGFLLSFLTKSVTEKFLTEKAAAMVETFFRENPLPGSERSVAQAVETVRVHAAWLARDGAALNQFLTS